MNKRKIILISLIVVLIVILLICVKCKNNSPESVDKENEENQSGDLVTTDVYYDTELYTSTNGYELRYNSKNFSIKYENNVETFRHKTEDVYLKIYIVNELDVEKTKSEMQEVSNRQGECSFANGTLKGTYIEEKLTENDDENKIKRNFMFDLDNKNMLVIETKMYASTEKNKLANNELNMMINTIKIQK